MKTNQKIYRLAPIENLIQNYLNKGGEILTAQEGVLGYGITVCIAEGYKTAVIKEVFLNEWNSGHTVTFYNKIPKKYDEMLIQYENNQ